MGWGVWRGVALRQEEGLESVFSNLKRQIPSKNPSPRPHLGSHNESPSGYSP